MRATESSPTHRGILCFSPLVEVEVPGEILRAPIGPMGALLTRKGDQPRLYGWSRCGARSSIESDHAPILDTDIPLLEQLVAPEPAREHCDVIEVEPFLESTR